MVADTVERIRPKMKIYETVKEIDEAITKVMADERTHMGTEEYAEDREDEEADEDDESDASGADESDDGEEDSESEEEESASEESDDGDDQEYSRGEEHSKQKADEVDQFEKEMQQLLIDSLEQSKNALRPSILRELPDPQPKKKGADEEKIPGSFGLLQKKAGKMVV